ncbi:MAG TPA: ABC transporter permease [Candidatus Saccharimonadales bacterium]|nr:ABC transporter permease [Candidatus Saccharimonadales bacterium]
MSRRSIRHTFRNVDALITGIMLPVAILVLFVVIFGGAIQTGTSYVNYIVPGVILTCVGYGASSTAMIVARDTTTGLFNRFRSLPIGLSSVLIGHVVGSMVRNSISTILVFAVALALGFRPNADLGEWLAVIGLLLLVIAAISWLAVIFGLLVKSIDAASGISFTIMFLPYISSAFVPLHTLPTWLKGFAEHQPFTPMIETLRGLLIGTSTETWPTALGWSAGILLLTYLLAILLLKMRAQG